ncbi:hypothetical protein EST38_g6832 [Candolleomyces aberdarensis]|uniref:Uncharacterized protein n=1 Tax=Candolleomyces aberdarensis TaxID=2316362 RepID=A0A4Q2DJM5_9AGAR|nr:hypothetical protein EST38_g6832 [Candolleomyces aberdarensis]
MTRKRHASYVEELEAERPLQRSTLAIDLWDDDQHQQLDHAIMSNSKFVRLNAQELTMQDFLLFPLLLKVVISQVNGKATDRDPSEIIFEDETLFHQLQDA